MTSLQLAPRTTDTMEVLEQVDDDIPSDELKRLKTSFYETKVVITEDRRTELRKA